MDTNLHPRKRRYQELSVPFEEEASDAGNERLQNYLLDRIHKLEKRSKARKFESVQLEKRLGKEVTRTQELEDRVAELEFSHAEQESNAILLEATNEELKSTINLLQSRAARAKEKIRNLEKESAKFMASNKVFEAVATFMEIDGASSLEDQRADFEIVWSKLLSSAGKSEQLTFETFPWPVYRSWRRPTPDALTPERLSAFFPKDERAKLWTRNFQIRFHPDKFPLIERHLVESSTNMNAIRLGFECIIKWLNTKDE